MKIKEYEQNCVLSSCWFATLAMQKHRQGSKPSKPKNKLTGQGSAQKQRVHL